MAAAVPSASELFINVLSKVSRPPLPLPSDPLPAPLVFQVNEVDYCSQRCKNEAMLPHWIDPEYARSKLRSFTGAWNFWACDTVPVMRMFGTTEDGRSVLARVHGFDPHFYSTIPAGADINSLRIELEKHAAQKMMQLDKAYGRTEQWQKPKSRKRKKNGYKRKQHNGSDSDDSSSESSGGEAGSDSDDRENDPGLGNSITTGFFSAESGAGKWPIITETSVVNNFKPLRGYVEPSHPAFQFLRISTRLPRHVPVVRHILEDIYHQVTYEADFPFALRFMTDKGITGCSWIKLGKLISPPSSPLPSASCLYEDRGGLGPGDGSRCSICVDVWHEDIEVLGTEGPWSKHAPMRILSFDIECVSRRKRFVDAKLGDPVITICSRIADTSASSIGDRRKDYAVVLQLGTCDAVPTPGVDTIACETEQELLLKWCQLVVAADPDILTGYNILNFDFRYLYQRAEQLGIGNEFLDLSRVPGQKMQCVIGGATKRSRAKGTQEADRITICGRIIYDVLVAAKNDTDPTMKLSSYTLNAVSEAVIKQHKLEMDHNLLPAMFFRGPPAARCKIATYCDQDAALPLSIISAKKYIAGLVEMARIVRLPPLLVVTRGQQIRVRSQLARIALDKGYLVETGKYDATEGAHYGGATVFTPDPGLHEYAIATLDFSGLYPSIIMGYNICYTTYLTKEQASGLHPDQYTTSPAGHSFVKAPVRFKKDKAVEEHLELGTHYTLDSSGMAYCIAGARINVDTATRLGLKKIVDYDCDTDTVAVINGVKRVGLLPSLLSGLSFARGAAKKLLEAEKDEGMKTVYDGRQLGLKLSSNATYGVTGANGVLLFKPIAESVTSWGCKNIKHTQNLVEEKYSKKNNHCANSSVKYGDTDSVFVDFGNRALQNPRQAIEVYINYLRQWTAVTVDYERLVGFFADYQTTSAMSSSLISSPAQLFSNARKIIEEFIAAAVAASVIDADCATTLGGVTITTALVQQQVDEAAVYAIEACDYVTTTIARPPMKIEFEKIIYMLVLSKRKKRYFGCRFVKIGKRMINVGLYVSGYEMKRRDNCLLARETMSNVFTNVALRYDVQAAIRDTRDAIAGIAQNTHSYFKYIITKSLSKKIKPFAQLQPQEALARRIEWRQAHADGTYNGTTIQYHTGDRIPYVKISNSKDAKANECSEDPIYAARNNIAIDTEYYITKQIVAPLRRVFKYVIPDRSRLDQVFDPSVPIDHVLAVGASSSSSSSSRVQPSMMMVQPPVATKIKGSIGAFAITMVLPCLSCHVVVPSDNPLCSQCMSKLPEIQRDTESCIAKLIDIENCAAKTCKTCIGQAGDDANNAKSCANVACKVFFDRIQNEQRISKCRRDLDRLANSGAPTPTFKKMWEDCTTITTTGAANAVTTAVTHITVPKKKRAKKKAKIINNKF